MAKYTSHILYGSISFVLLVLVIIGFSFCSSYKNKSETLTDSLNTKNAENSNLVSKIKALEDKLETTSNQLKAKTTEADMLSAALSDLRGRVNTVPAEKDKGGTGKTAP